MPHFATINYAVQSIFVRSEMSADEIFACSSGGIFYIASTVRLRYGIDKASWLVIAPLDS